MSEQTPGEPDAGDEAPITPPPITPPTTAPTEPGWATADIPPPYVPGTSPVRKSGRAAALLVGAVALVGGVAFAAAQMGGSAGGAESPQAAVEHLLDSVSDGDIVGVFESLPDGERQAIQDPAEDITNELKRLGVVDGGFSLSDVGGYHLEFSDMTYDVRDLGGGVSSVTIAGTVGAQLQPKDLPVGDVVKEAGGETSNEIDQLEPETNSTDFDGVRLVTVEDGGAWYVSAFYTAAEYIREASTEDLAAPSFGHGVPAVGSDSPEDAVQAMVEAGVGLDPRAAVSLLPPKEMRVVHDYAPLFLDDLEADAADEREVTQLHVDDLDLTSDTDGDTAVVTAKSFSISGTSDGEDGSVTWDGSCFTVTGSATDEGEDDSFCQKDLTKALADAELSGINLDLADFVAVTTVREDGKWYVSPVRSAFAPYITLLQAIDKDELQKAIKNFSEDGGLSSLLLGPAGILGTTSDEKFSEVGNCIGSYDESTGGSTDCEAGTTDTTIQYNGPGDVKIPDHSQLALRAILIGELGPETGQCAAEQLGPRLSTDEINALIDSLSLGDPIPPDLQSTYDDVVASCP